MSGILWKRIISLMISFAIISNSSCSHDHGILVIASTDQKGYLRNCGCGNLQLGGLARRASIVKKLKADFSSERILQVDAGGFSEVFTSEGIIKTEMVLQIYRDLGLSAINISVSELGRDANVILEILEETKIPYISANIVSEGSQQPYFPAFVIVEKLNKKIGIIGITEHVRRRWKLKSGEKLKTCDPEIALSKLLPALRDKVDTIVLLAHLPKRKLKDLAKDLVSVDLIVAGDGYSGFEKGNLRGDLKFFFPGVKGQYLGKMSLLFRENGVELLLQEPVPVKKETIPDGAIDSLISQYESSIQ